MAGDVARIRLSPVRVSIITTANPVAVPALTLGHKRRAWLKAALRQEEERCLRLRLI